MENSTVTHIKVGEKHRLVIEQAASATRNQLGWKAETNGDTIEEVTQAMTLLKKIAEQMAPAVQAPVKG